MLATIIQMLSASFMVRAIIVGVLVSLCASLLGVTLTLKRYSMIGDGLSHVAFGSLAIATVLQISPLYFSLPVVIIVAFLLLRVNENSSLHGDSAIAIVSAGSMAIGVMAISVTSGTNIDLNNYLFGSILAVGDFDMMLTIVMAIIVLSLFFAFYREIFAITFDEIFAKAIGIRVTMYTTLLAILTSIVIVIGMRLMGSLLISSLILFPTITAMMICKSFTSVTICAIFISILTFLIGITISYVYSTPVGASIVCINSIFLLISYMIKTFKKGL